MKKTQQSLAATCAALEVAQSKLVTVDQLKAVADDAREQLATAITAQDRRVDARHEEDTANFREIRLRLDAANETLLRIALAAWSTP